MTSRSAHRLVMPHIWRDIVITRPSTLALLHQAIAPRPQLAFLIKGLYAGPVEPLPSDWWPRYAGLPSSAESEYYASSVESEYTSSDEAVEETLASGQQRHEARLSEL